MNSTDSVTWRNEGTAVVTQVDMINTWFIVMIIEVEIWKEDNIQYKK